MPKALVMLIVVIAGGAVAISRDDTDSNVPASTAQEPRAVVTDEKTTAGDVAYKDGIYATTGNYVSPGGPETIDVTLTVEGGTIVEASVVGNAVNPGSKKFQGMFVEGYREYVVGRELSGLSLPVVSGSSLTTKGFNDALEDIRAQAGA